jgi:hypothetical protein
MRNQRQQKTPKVNMGQMQILEPVAGDAAELSADFEKAEIDKQHILMQTSLLSGAPSGKVDTSAQPNVLPVLPTEPEKGGKGGKGGAVLITNAEFIEAVFRRIPDGAFAAVCSKHGDPDKGGWYAERADQEGTNLRSEANNYINCSSFYPSDDGSIKARKAQFAACHFLMLDDIGTKVAQDRLRDLPLSWLTESSSGNHQGGIILSEPITDGAVAERLLKALIEAGLCDAGSSGPLTRWARLPVGINGKPKHARIDGTPFQCRLIEWRPEVRYTPQEIVDRLGLKMDSEGPQKSAANSKRLLNAHNTDTDEVLTPKPEENPVITALKARGLYKTPLGSGKHDITCPWVQEHTDGLDTGAAYFEPDDSYPVGGFCCQHSHREKYPIKALLGVLGVQNVEARHKSVIRVIAGDLDRVVDAAEKELAENGRHYQAGGLIVSLVTDPTTGDPSIVPISANALRRELSVVSLWERYDRRSDEWIRCDPPSAHSSILYDSQKFRHLLPLAGLARQPYFRESDGELITRPGYDKISQRFAVFDGKQFVVPNNPTPNDVQVALSLLEDLLGEFHFVASNDKAAALAAIFTAVVRPSLSYAPAFHVRAPAMGSGKTYLCELIGAFAGPARNTKVSYPTTSEEANKVILALLLTSPAVIEFDDMDGDWSPFGTIKQMLTSDQITARILGVSKTAKVSTRTLFLGSGNNVGPVRDLLRRVLTIHLDTGCATPATMAYRGAPVDKVRQNRGKYVSAVLTIIQAWRKAGMPRVETDSIVTYAGAWADYCRYPLMWLGHKDPATTLVEQVRHDPDGDALGELMVEWYGVFGSTPTTVRKVVDRLKAHSSLKDAIRELPVEERGVISNAKLGCFLKKNVNRIVNGLKFEQSKADGRVAWRVVRIETPLSPPLPPSDPSDEKTGDGWSEQI